MVHSTVATPGKSGTKLKKNEWMKLIYATMSSLVSQRTFQSMVCQNTIYFLIYVYSVLCHGKDWLNCWSLYFQISTLANLWLASIFAVLCDWKNEVQKLNILYIVQITVKWDTWLAAGCFETKHFNTALF